MLSCALFSLSMSLTAISAETSTNSQPPADTYHFEAVGVNFVLSAAMGIPLTILSAIETGIMFGESVRPAITVGPAGPQPAKTLAEPVIAGIATLTHGLYMAGIASILPLFLFSRQRAAWNRLRWRLEKQNRSVVELAAAGRHATRNSLSYDVRLALEHQKASLNGVAVIGLMGSVLSGLVAWVNVAGATAGAFNEGSSSLRLLGPAVITLIQIPFSITFAANALASAITAAWIARILDGTADQLPESLSPDGQPKISILPDFGILPNGGITTGFTARF